MFGLFKKYPSPNEFVERLRPYCSEVVSLVNVIDGPFVNLYEAGIFVSTVATSKILMFKKVDPPAFADEFNAKWVSCIPYPAIWFGGLDRKVNDNDWS